MLDLSVLKVHCKFQILGHRPSAVYAIFLYRFVFFFVFFYTPVISRFWIFWHRDSSFLFNRTLCFRTGTNLVPVEAELATFSDLLPSPRGSDLTKKVPRMERLLSYYGWSELSTSSSDFCGPKLTQKVDTDLGLKRLYTGLQITPSQAHTGFI